MFREFFSDFLKQTHSRPYEKLLAEFEMKQLKIEKLNMSMTNLASRSPEALGACSNSECMEVGGWEGKASPVAK